jgi:2-oxoglutarate ferredoxin oxidoreductase subunit alpha
MAGAELPGVIVNVMRGGPGLGTIQPSQADYFQSVKGGGHGDYKMPVLAPASVQEMADFTVLAFELAFKYLTPAMVLADGIIGQMMEKVILPPYQPRLTEEEIRTRYPWTTLGKTKDRKPNYISSLELQSEEMERINQRLQARYRDMEENEVRFEQIACEDADYVFVAFGTMARVCQKAVELARAEGIKAGLIRPITLFPFPKKIIKELATRVKGFISIEMSAGQMVEDVRLAVSGKVPVEFYGRMGGIVPSPDEVLHALKTKLL